MKFYEIFEIYIVNLPEMSNRQNWGVIFRFGPTLKFLYICHNIAMQSHLLKNGKMCGPLLLLWQQ
jgi:hypothetical protein